MLGKLRKDKLLWQIIRFNLLIIFVGLLVLIIKSHQLPTLVPLFYSRPWGEEQLAPSSFLFLIPSFSLVIYIFNLFFSRLLLNKGEKFLALLSQGFALLFSVLGTITLVKIVFLTT